jgi:arabinogalactan endo-1,4-beta-galactosidase/type II secretory pathway pseudopilin PulG
MTLIEIIVSLAIITIILAVIVPQFVMIRNSWASKEAATETLQNGRILLDHLERNLLKAVKITSVSSSSTTSGYIQFQDNDGNSFRYDINSTNNYVEYGAPGSLSDLAGPVSQLQFRCYDACNLDTPLDPITDANLIRFVKVETTLTNSVSSSRNKTLIASAYLRTNANTGCGPKGADISTLTKEEAFGVKYNEYGIQKDLLTILKNHGITLARIRLFVDPNTSDTGTAMDLAYVTALAARCKAAGMQVMLALHYSDTWADSGTQTKPTAWKKLNQAKLVTQVYNYTYSVCSTIKPDYVQIGNAINCGMLWPNGEVCTAGNWANLRALITAGHNGAKAGGGGTTIVHVAMSDAPAVKWFFDLLLASSVSFDTIGVSYYPEWQGNIANFSAINAQAAAYGKGVIVCEMADYYTDVSGKTEDTQAQFVTDVLAVNSNAIYWEPGWVWDSTVGYKALFKPISGDWKNVEMTKGLVAFGGDLRP